MDDPRLELSAWLHGELLAAYAAEREEAWALERVRRVMDRLNGVRRTGAPLVAEVLRIPQVTAFTLPGPYVYVSRRLLERCPSDEAAAFVLAHEAAHHDLGHTELFTGWADWIPRVSAGGYVAALVVMLEHKVYGPEREAQADLRAVDLCLDAGYHGERCLQLFDILENHALDRGDYDGVFGPENLLDPTDPGQGGIAHHLQRWLWSRGRGYLPLRERRDRAWAHLSARARPPPR